MQKLLIHCQSEVENGEKMKAFLETRLPYSVQISFDRRSTHDILTQRTLHLLIYETERFNDSDLQFIRDLRGVGFSHPALIIAENISVPNVHLIMDKLKGHFLEKPFEYKALRGITQKLMLARNVPQQQHRRFRTHQNTVLETYISGDAIHSQMYNLSVGGAYVEYNDRTKLAVGDLVRLKIPLQDLSREHSVNARVVWTTRKGMNSGGFGAGIRFIKGNDIYRQLIDRV